MNESSDQLIERRQAERRHADRRRRISVVSERDIGNIEARLQRCEDDIEELKNHVDDLRQKSSEMKGSWKTLVTIVSASGAAGAAAYKLFSILAPAVHP